MLARYRDDRGVVLGGRRGEFGDLGPGHDWDILVYVERGRLDRLDFAPRMPEFTVTMTPHMPFVGAEGFARLNDGDVVDVLFIDAELVRRSVGDSERGLFTLCPMARLISGMPSYVVESEVARGSRLADGVPAVPDRPPERLVENASSWWFGRASLSLLLADDCVAQQDHVAALAHLLAAVESFVHSVSITEGWYLPSKSFVTRSLRRLPGGDRVLELLDGRATTETVREIGDNLRLTKAAGLAWAAEGRERGLL